MVRGAMWMENILPGHRSANSPPAVADESGSGGGDGGGSVSPRSLPPYQAPPPPPPSYPHSSGGATKRYSTGGTGGGGGGGGVVTSAAASGYNPWLVRVRAMTGETVFIPFLAPFCAGAHAWLRAAHRATAPIVIPVRIICLEQSRSL